jgi:hypothetical protein
MALVIGWGSLARIRLLIKMSKTESFVHLTSRLLNLKHQKKKKKQIMPDNLMLLAW